MATVMLVDFENFADLTSSVEPRVLVEQLDQYFSTFDRIVREHSLQMIKTIGDTYICVAGLPEITRDHAIQACGSALAVKRTMDRANAERRKLSLREWRPRIVVHAESMVAGLIGEKRTTFDLWGAGANVARCLIRKCRPVKSLSRRRLSDSSPNTVGLRIEAVSTLTRLDQSRCTA
jgi:adenylate cyclase